MHDSSAEVAYFEEQHALKVAAGEAVVRTSWDDHSKIEAGKKRGRLNGRRCVMHKRRVASAPYSDMGVKLGGVKLVINSMLFALPPGTDLEHDATSISKRGGGTLVHKQAVAVVRIDTERRSTPMQQFNDLRYASSPSSPPSFPR